MENIKLSIYYGKLIINNCTDYDVNYGICEKSMLRDKIHKYVDSKYDSKDSIFPNETIWTD